MNAIKRYCGYWRPYYYAECAADLHGAAELLGGADLLGGAGAHCTGAALRSSPSLHLPTSPYMSLHLPTSPYISLYLLTLSSSSRVNMKTACTWEMEGDIGRCREM